MQGSVFEIYPLQVIDDPEQSTSGCRVGFTVSSVNATLAELAKGYPRCVVSSPKASKWGYRAVIQDPDGHKVELVDRSTKT